MLCSMQRANRSLARDLLCSMQRASLLRGMKWPFAYAAAPNQFLYLESAAPKWFATGHGMPRRRLARCMLHSKSRAKLRLARCMLHSMQRANRSLACLMLARHAPHAWALQGGGLGTARGGGGARAER